MGGCASKTKELDGHDINNLPAEKPASPEVTSEPVAVEAPSEAKDAVIENQNDKEAAEKPLVDLSSPKPNIPSTVVDAATGIEELKLDAPQNPSTDSGDAKDADSHTEPNAVKVADDTAAKNAEAAVESFKETETKKVDAEAEKTN